MGLVTYATRLSFILLQDKVAMPKLVQQALRYVPPAVLAAIIFPQVLMPGNVLNLSLDNMRIWAALVAAILAWRTRNVMLAIGAGMVTLWVLQALFP